MSEIQIDNISDHKELSQIENYQNISLKLKELIKLIKGGQKTDDNKNNIIEYILYPEIISFNELKNKIFSFFNVNNNIEFYSFLLEEIKNLFQKEKAIKNSLEEISIRGHFYKLLEYLNFFISYSLIYFPNTNENESRAFNYFITWIINDNSMSKSILSSYINIFNLHNILFDFYSTKRDLLLCINDINRVFALISILKMQNIFTFKFIIKEKYKNILFQNLCIYELYRTYNTSLKEIYDLTNFILSINTNYIESSIIEKILNDKEIKDKIDDNIRILLIEKLMTNYSLLKEYEKNKEKDIISYFRIVSKYINIIPQNYSINWKIMNKIFKDFIDNKEYDKCIYFINGIKDINIINKCIDDKLIDTLITSIPIGKILLISNLIKSNKSLINYILNINRSKDGIKLIKSLQIDRNEYDELFDEISMNNFFIYKINTCIDTSFDILIDYGLINESSYNKLINKLMKKSYINDSENNNDSNYLDNSLPLNEDEYEKTKEVTPKKNISNINNFDDLNKFFLNESNEKITKSKDNKMKQNILNQVDKEKILCLYNFANKKNYYLTNRNKKLFDKIFLDISLINFNLIINKYIPEDKYEPHDPSCLSINIKAQKIVFIDNIKTLNENYNFFKKTKFIGIDSEWRQSFYANNTKESASILQLCNYSEKNIMIIDLIKMREDNQFLELFINNFKDKKFIGYAFNNSDIDQFNESLQKMFQETVIIDLIDIYQHKYLEKAPSLKDMCLKFLGSKLCKYEQCSNWENRPLKKRQLHYAALDAIVCISLYKKMTGNL